MTKKRKYFISLTVLITILSTIAITVFMHERSGLSSAQTRSHDDAPTLDFENEVAAKKTEARKNKGIQFQGLGNPDGGKVISELAAGVEPLPTNSHWWVGISALPAKQSDVVVLGRVINRSAHLTADQTGIYSEFSVLVEQVFKDSSGTVLVNRTIDVNRVGGNVRFASGKIQKYSIARQGMPLKASKYLFFLRRTDPNLVILTGYEFLEDRVEPLDGEDIEDSRAALPFAKYRGTNPSDLLKELRATISKSEKGDRQ